MSVSLEQAGELVQHRTQILDREHEPVGVLAQMYVDEDTDEPLWAAVVFDPPSDIETVVPIHDAHVVNDALVTSYPRSLIEAGPRIAAGDELPWVEEDRLRAHYGQRTPAVDAAVLTPITDL